MRRYLLVAAVTAAAATLTAIVLPGAAPAGAAGPGRRAEPGTQLWVARYNDPANRADGASAVAVGPGGRRVFVTGTSASGGATGRDYATVAYSAATGRHLWVSRYGGAATAAGNRNDVARAVVVSPGGSRVFVTGSTHGQGTGNDFATVAYSAATGKQLWVSVYNGAANGPDHASAMAVSPAGTAVFVTGYSAGPTGAYDYATVAYSAATGRQLWASRYNGPADGPDYPLSVAVNPAGDAVFVTGQSYGGQGTGFDYATVAYDASTGSQLWARRYNGPANGFDGASSVAVGPGGSTVFVTGSSDGGRATTADYATFAYDAATGRQLWARRYNGPASKSDSAAAVAVSPDGTMVFVTGSSFGGRAVGDDYATVAYNAAAGRQLWVRRYNGPANQPDSAAAVAVSPGGTVYVTGTSGDMSGAGLVYDYATVAYRAATGAQPWARRYDGPANGADTACCVAVSPAGTTVFVTGSSAGEATSVDYATIAYRS